MQSKYQLVPVAGSYSIHFSEYKETIHPGLGPVAEAEALYVRQLNLVERLAAAQGEFIVWDIGLGAAANALTVLKSTREIPSQLRLVSFDNTLEPFRFALAQNDKLPFFAGYENVVADLVSGKESQVEFPNGKQAVIWKIHVGDFPSLVQNVDSPLKALAPDAILFDPFSPKKNPAMWTQSVFTNLFQLLNPKKPCSLATYSRSTMTRVALLKAGFFVGAGYATGAKEETTVAANTLELIAKPLDQRWLERAQRSDSAEPLVEAVYRRAKLAPETLEKLKRHSQFS
jgi:tRNA U34 5-methylaminomethyl-2-thiouridine-forming methyltransferase MnmC